MSEPETSPRAMMNRKPVFSVPAKTVINFKSGFGKKLLCDDLTFTTGTACAYSCSFCYVPSAMEKQMPYLQKHGVQGRHKDIVVRRADAIETLREQLVDKSGKPRFKDEYDERVIYASPLVDVAANMELVNETVAACKLILEHTFWQIRLLSKSNLLPKIAQQLDSLRGDQVLGAKRRIIYGVSTGTLNDGLAKAFEEGTPLVSKRIESLHWLQDNGYRTFGMVCPSLPMGSFDEYQFFAEQCFNTLRYDHFETVWAEVINLRGESFTRTVAALRNGGFEKQADLVVGVSDDKAKWEQYARDTYKAHLWAMGGQKKKLRFLQYVTKENRDFWHGAPGVVEL